MAASPSRHLPGLVLTGLLWSLAWPLGAVAGPADDAWASILTLDAGPSGATGTGEQVRLAAITHLEKQEQALRGFLGAYPKDPHTFEAQLRLARLLQIRADVRNEPKALAEASRLLDQLDKGSTPEQKAELGFARLTMLMRTLRAAGDEKRERLLTAARKFQKEYPNDRRLGSVLAEMATLFQSQPKKMKELLLEAEPLARDPELRSRIADDLKRLDQIGQVVLLRGLDLSGKPVDLEQFRGSVVAVCFFALWSAPSVSAMEALKRATTELPKGSLRVIGVSLDPEAAPVAALAKERALAWPIIWDGKGWESGAIRPLGINAVPTVWLVDRQGRLRSLVGLEGTVTQARQLNHER